MADQETTELLRGDLTPEAVARQELMEQGRAVTEEIQQHEQRLAYLHAILQKISGGLEMLDKLAGMRGEPVVEPGSQHLPATADPTPLDVAPNVASDQLAPARTPRPRKRT